MHKFAGFYVCRLLQCCVHGELRCHVDYCSVMSIGLLGLTSVDSSSAVSIDNFALMCIDHCNVMSIGLLGRVILRRSAPLPLLDSGTLHFVNSFDE